jgi:signal transduction histidine kinase
LSSTVLITIEDDGVGFDAAYVQQSGARAGLGLLGIRERVAQLRGTVRLESGQGKGTRLTVELPARMRPPSHDNDSNDVDVVHTEAFDG